MRARVIVRLKPGVLDPQGTAVEKSLHTLGFADVANVRVQKLIELDIPGDDAAAVKAQAVAMADKLLRNPVIEDAIVEVG
jgi:phosphoribosylformylglycinamidine synthase PurS subunit